MTRDQEMIAQLEKVFPLRTVGACLTSATDPEIHIYEDEQAQKAQISARKMAEGESFRLINPTEKKIYLLSVDNCFMVNGDGYTGKRCDGIILDDQHFCFTELKLSAKSKGKRKTKAKEAREQLGATITFFQNEFENQAKDFLGYILEAYVVLGRKKVHPSHRAHQAEIRATFLAQYGVDLFEEVEKMF